MKNATVLLLAALVSGCLMTPSVIQALPGNSFPAYSIDLAEQPAEWHPAITMVESVYTECEEIRNGCVLIPDPELRFGRFEEVINGELGEKEITVRTLMVDGELLEREILSEEILKPPVDRVTKVGLGAGWPAEKLLRVTSYFDMEATAYDPGPESNGKWTGFPTAYGLEVGYGVVAVDPRVIPLGTMLFVEGYGYAIAGDTGGAIKNMRIDLGYDTRPEALRFGRRDVRVFCIDA